tara:strand:+ start:411 stop:524 length:114 start_codon:yes stop_codon:yes gene_type:complete
MKFFKKIKIYILRKYYSMKYKIEKYIKKKKKKDFIYD